MALDSSWIVLLIKTKLLANGLAFAINSANKLPKQ